MQGVTYGGPGGTRYGAAACAVSVPHREIRCRTAPGSGRGHRWLVRVASQVSPLSPVSSSYAAPSLLSLLPVSPPPPPAGHSTEGGVRMRAIGANFGPPGDDVRLLFGGVAGCGSDPATPAGGAGCPRVVARDHTSVVFDTPVGEGANLTVEVQASGVLSNSLDYS